MCGIAGYFNPDQNYAENPKQNFHTLSRMINTMNHRGPDTYGHTIINSCCLAHTRLSIIDLEMADSPCLIRRTETPTILYITARSTTTRK